MGGYIKDSSALDVIVKLNARFEVGDAIEEMVALQKRVSDLFAQAQPEAFIRRSEYRTDRVVGTEKMVQVPRQSQILRVRSGWRRRPR